MTFSDEVRGILQTYLDQGDISPVTVDKLVARLMGVTLREHATDGVAAGVEAVFNRIKDRLT